MINNKEVEVSLKEKIYIPLILIGIISVLVIGVFFYFDLMKAKKIMIDKLKHTLINIYELKMEEKRNVGMVGALMLADNSTIIKALKTKNRDLALKEVNKFLKDSKEFTKFQNIKIHIHTKDLRSFLRSWKPNVWGDDLSYFRHTIVWVKNNKKPLVAMEFGKAGLVLRAIAPVFDDNKYIGSVEFMQGLNSIAKDLEQRGYHFLVLFKKNYLNIATFLQQRNKKIKTKFIVALKEGVYNKRFYNEIKFQEMTPVIVTKNFYAVSIPIKDFKGNIIAYAVLGEDNKDIQEMIKNLIKNKLYTILIVISSILLILFFISYIIQNAIISPINELKERIKKL